MSVGKGAISGIGALRFLLCRISSGDRPSVGTGAGGTGAEILDKIGARSCVKRIPCMNWFVTGALCALFPCHPEDTFLILKLCAAKDTLKGHHLHLQLSGGFVEEPMLLCNGPREGSTQSVALLVLVTARN